MLCSPTPPVSVDGDERFAKLLSKDEDQNDREKEKERLLADIECLQEALALENIK